MNNVVETKTFQEKMFERIREQMGDLLSEDELKTILQTAVQKAFFDPVQEKDRYGNISSTKEPYFISLVREEMKANIKELMANWMKENSELVNKTIDDAIAKGMFGLVQQHFDMVAQIPLMNFANQLRNAGVLK